MTDTAPDTQSPGEGRPAKCRGRGRRTFTIAAVALAAGLAGAFATNAISEGRGGGWHHGPGWFHGGGKHGGPMGMGFMGGPTDPDKAQRQAGRMAERFARRIDATGEQQAKLIAIAEAAARDVAPMRQKMRDARADGMKLLAGASIDRAAIEKLRADQLANMDQLSKRMAAAMADAAEVLTPEQRQKVAERMEKRREGRGWGRGWGKGDGEGRGGPGEGPGRGPGGPGGEPAPQQKN